MDKIYSLVLVLIQFICIGLLAATTTINNLLYIPLLLIISGVFIGLLALWVMKQSKIHITPDVDKKAVLITNGPYKYIRHPMYSAVLLTCLGLVLTNPSLIRLIIFLLLIIDLIIKLHYEETLLEKNFPGYKQYKEKTSQIIPFIY